MGAEGDEGVEENEGDDGLQFSHLLMVRAEGADGKISVLFTTSLKQNSTTEHISFR